MATQYGTELVIGVGTTFGSYIVASITTGEQILNGPEDINDEDGALATRLVKQKRAVVEMELICKTGAAPETDWPEGSLSGATGWTSYFVLSARFTRTENPRRGTVRLEYINLALVV